MTAQGEPVVELKRTDGATIVTIKHCGGEVALTVGHWNCCACGRVHAVESATVLYFQDEKLRIRTKMERADTGCPRVDEEWDVELEGYVKPEPDFDQRLRMAQAVTIPPLITDDCMYYSWPCILNLEKDENTGTATWIVREQVDNLSYFMDGYKCWSQAQFRFSKWYWEVGCRPVLLKEETFLYQRSSGSFTYPAIPQTLLSLAAAVLVLC